MRGPAKASAPTCSDGINGGRDRPLRGHPALRAGAGPCVALDERDAACACREMSKTCRRRRLPTCAKACGNLGMATLRIGPAPARWPVGSARHAVPPEKPTKAKVYLGFSRFDLGFSWLSRPEKANKSQPKPRKAKVCAPRPIGASGAACHRAVMAVVRCGGRGLQKARQASRREFCRSSPPGDRPRRPASTSEGPLFTCSRKS